MSSYGIELAFRLGRVHHFIAIFHLLAFTGTLLGKSPGSMYSEDLA